MLHLTVTTPEKVIVDTEVSEVRIPTTTGEITILPSHVPLVTQIATGVLTITTHGKEETLAVDGGFVQVTPKEVKILSDFAVHAREISAVKAEEAKKAAEKAMKERKSDVDFALAEAEFRRAILELNLAHRNKSH